MNSKSFEKLENVWKLMSASGIVFVLGITAWRRESGNSEQGEP